MKRHLTLLLLCITALLSCSKDEETPILQTGVYMNDGRAIAGPITLYVGSTHITERNFIHHFLERRVGNWLADSTLSELTGTSVRFYQVTMTISNDSTAYYNLSPNYQDTFRISSLSDDRRLLVANRASLVSPQLMGELNCGNVEKYLRMNPPSYTCGYFNYPASYCTGKKQFQLNLEGDHLVMPVLTYYFARPVEPGIFCNTSARYINDDLNKDVFNRLRPDDTLAVQTYFVKLYRQ